MLSDMKATIEEGLQVEGQLTISWTDENNTPEDWSYPDHQ